MSQPKPVMVLSTPFGPVAINPTLPGVRKQLVCAKEGCKNMAVGRWQYGDGKFSEKQYCNLHYAEEHQNALLEEARKQRREAMKT